MADEGRLEKARAILKEILAHLQETMAADVNMMVLIVKSHDGALGIIRTETVSKPDQQATPIADLLLDALKHEGTQDYNYNHMEFRKLPRRG
jgi:hypothetical protein